MWVRLHTERCVWESARHTHKLALRLGTTVSVWFLFPLFISLLFFNPYAKFIICKFKHPCKRGWAQENLSFGSHMRVNRLRDEGFSIFIKMLISVKAWNGSPMSGASWANRIPEYGSMSTVSGRQQRRQVPQGPVSVTVTVCTGFCVCVCWDPLPASRDCPGGIGIVSYKCVS